MLKAAVRLPSDGEDAARVGHVEFLDNAVQNGSGRVNLRATMGNPDRHFWPGQFVDVKLVQSTEKGAALIPNLAAQISQKGSVVCRDRSVVGSPTEGGAQDEPADHRKDGGVGGDAQADGDHNSSHETE